jgi:hypothetical protein
MRNFTGPLLFVLIGTFAQAAPAVRPAAPIATRPAGPPAGRLQAQSTLFTQKSLGPKGYLKADQIGGCCLLLGTLVRVENLDGKTLSESKTETIDTFTLSGLKPSTAYNLILINSRYKTPIKLEKVMSGNWINFKSP